VTSDVRVDTRHLLCYADQQLAEKTRLHLSTLSSPPPPLLCLGPLVQGQHSGPSPVGAPHGRRSMRSLGGALAPGRRDLTDATKQRAQITTTTTRPHDPHDRRRQCRRPPHHTHRRALPSCVAVRPMAACVVEQSGVRAGGANRKHDRRAVYKSYKQRRHTRRARYLGLPKHRHPPPSPPTPPTAPACIVLPCAGCCAAGSYAEASGREGAAVPLFCVWLTFVRRRLRRRIGRGQARGGQARGAGRARERAPRDVRAHPETRTRELALVYQTNRSSRAGGEAQWVGGREEGRSPGASKVAPFVLRLPNETRRIQQ
jgi:hypothetical protein